MQSKIRIEHNGERPVIRVTHIESEDLRDSMIKMFKEFFGHKSMWCKVYFKCDGVIDIVPIYPNELESEADIMAKVSRS